MAKKNPTTEMPEFYSDVVKSLQSALSPSPMIAPQVEQFWNTQENILNEAEAYTRHWFERRHEATRTAMLAARKSTTGEKGAPGDAMQTIADWQRHSMERMVEDAHEWLNMITRCANYVSQSELEIAEAAKKTAEKAVKSAKSEPV
ncbi:hypothetical protein [uncultured Roseovarius sp.]|uniref:hypothetical protein n=1 Tax=uncultured Roseovarius sp. TaxID=293344 RepID=UPI002609DC4C|nr:hypothetical protein [uncultured Roseovarius sp.]